MRHGILVTIFAVLMLGLAGLPVEAQRPMPCDVDCDPEPPPPPPPPPDPGPFTPGSGVTQLDANTFYIGANALFTQGGAALVEARLPFTLPPSGTVVAVQATLSHKAICFAQALMELRIDGKAYPVITKLPAAGGALNIFLDFDVPLVYGPGSAELFVVNQQVCDTSSAAEDVTTWEFQGLLRVQ